MNEMDKLAEQLFNTASELMEMLDAKTFEITETDVLSDLTFNIKIERIREDK